MVLNWKQTTFDSIFERPVMEWPVKGEEPNDPQPGPSGLQTPVMVEDDEMAEDNPPSFCACPPTNPKPATHRPSIQASPAALHLKVRTNLCLIKFHHDKVYKSSFTYECHFWCHKHI
jgi:hypothetical protein